jgi:chromosome segregation ATPase
MARLEGLLDKKAAQVEKLVASHRALLKSRAAREDELNEQVTNMRQELDQAAVQRKLIEQGRKHLEQQAEILKQSIKSKSEELNTLLRQMDAVTHERNSAHDRITVMEQMQHQHEELMSNLQTKYNQAMEQVPAARMPDESLNTAIIEP